MRSALRRLACAAAAAVLLGSVALTAGCSLVGWAGNPSDDELIEEALAFGEVVLPPSATVRGVDRQQGRDTLYALAVALDPDEVDLLLAGSGFTEELVEQRTVVMSAVDGSDLDAATDFASAQDRLEPAGDRSYAVYRDVLVDRTDPASTVVHWWMFTT